MVSEKYFKGATIQVVNANKLYVCIGDIRYIFEEGKYVGYYKP